MTITPTSLCSPGPCPSIIMIYPFCTEVNKSPLSRVVKSFRLMMDGRIHRGAFHFFSSWQDGQIWSSSFVRYEVGMDCNCFPIRAKNTSPPLVLECFLTPVMLSYTKDTISHSPFAHAVCPSPLQEFKNWLGLSMENEPVTYDLFYGTLCHQAFKTFLNSIFPSQNSTLFLLNFEWFFIFSH